MVDCYDLHSLSNACQSAILAVNRMRISIPKLKATILYFCEHTDSKFLGKVKLMKLFYYLDFTHVKKFGSPITFDQYVKLDHGPIPSTIKNMVDDADADPDSSPLADTIDIQKEDGVMMHRIVARRKMTEFDKKLFSKSEMRILEEICKRFGNKNMKFIEDASHEEAPWKESGMYQAIPYQLAAHDSDCQVDVEDIDLAMQISNA